MGAGPVPGVETVVLGEGLPVTVFAHGLGGSTAEVRPVAAGLPGTRVLLSFRGHGGSDPLPGGWDYPGLADDLLAVADHHGATRAVGLSLGAGALLHLLVAKPERFEKAALVLPAVVEDARDDGAVRSLERLGAAVDAGDVPAVTELLLAEVPEPYRSGRAARIVLGRRAAGLVRKPAPRPAGHGTPVADRAELSAVRLPVLVVGQAGDLLHPLGLARELARDLPAATLLELPPGGVFWSASDTLRDALEEHLG